MTRGSKLTALVLAVAVFAVALAYGPRVMLGLVVKLMQMQHPSDGSMGDTAGWMFVFGWPLFAAADLAISFVLALCIYVLSLKWLSR